MSIVSNTVLAPNTTGVCADCRARYIQCPHTVRSDIHLGTRITYMEQAFNYMQKLYPNYGRERLYTISLNNDMEVVSYSLVAEGEFDHIPRVSSRELFGPTLAAQARYMVMSHNHPTLDIHPSSTDRRFTSKMLDRAKLLDIMILDHIIVAPAYNEGYSMRRNNKMNGQPRATEFPDRPRTHLQFRGGKLLW